MTGPQAFTIFGMVVEMIGFSVVGIYLMKQWKRTALQGQTFVPTRIWALYRRFFRRPPVSVTADAAMDGAGVLEVAGVQVDLMFDENGTAEDRLQRLEEAMNDVYNGQLAATSLMSQRVDAVESLLFESERALATRMKATEIDWTRESANDLRNAGWGLIFAIFGLLIQLVAVL